MVESANLNPRFFDIVFELSPT